MTFYLVYFYVRPALRFFSSVPLVSLALPISILVGIPILSALKFSPFPFYSSVVAKPSVCLSVLPLLLLLLVFYNFYND